MITPDQIEELQNIVRDNHSIFILNSLGPDYLSTEDKLRLKKVGVNLDARSISFVDQSFFLGILSDFVKDNKAFNYNELKEHIVRGQYIPLTVGETAQLNSVTLQTLKDIRSLNGKIFSDLNQILVNSSVSSQKTFLVNEISEGLGNKNTVEQISREISNKTGDWGRDFDRIVQYTTQNAYETGKSVSIERYSDQEDPLVYKVVYNAACRHCIRLYLTKGIGSKPIIYKLSELRKNGNNIGLKVDDWKAVIGPTHPYCRCNLMELRRGEVWNEELRKFELSSSELQRKSKRRRVKIKVGNKEFIG